MRFDVISNSRSAHQLTHQAAMIEGLKALGIEARAVGSFETTDAKYVACWGWRTGQRLRDAGHEVLVMERGYIGDRFAMTSLAWNGLNGYGRFPECPDDGGERFRQHATLKPWRDYGDYVLMLGQVPHDASLKGVDLMPWYVDQTAKIIQKYNVPVRFRQHPDLTSRGIKQYVHGTEKSEGSLQDELSRAIFTICYNSNSAVDSVLAGVPAVVDNPGSMAYEVAGHDYRDIIRTYREPWAHQLAWKQWSIDEIKSGYALRGVIGSAC